MSAKAIAAENGMFKGVMKLFASSKFTPKVFQAPAGDATDFPDFGIQITVNKKKVDLHIEYKMSTSEPMGSLRRWIFSGSKYSVDRMSMALEGKHDELREAGKKITESDIDRLEKMTKGDDVAEELVDLMNASSACKSEGRKLLTEIKKWTAPKKGERGSITTIQSGMFSAIQSRQEKYNRLIRFGSVENDPKPDLLKKWNAIKGANKGSVPEVFTKGTKMYYTLPTIKDASLGTRVVTHYHEKFVASQKKSDGDLKLLYFLMGKKIWYVEEGKGSRLSKADKDAIRDAISTALCPNSSITTLGKMSAQLEVRIQPRHLSKCKLEVKPKNGWGKNDSLELNAADIYRLKYTGDSNPYIDVMASFRLSAEPTGGGVIN